MTSFLGEEVWQPRIAGKIGQSYRLTRTELARSTNEWGWMTLNVDGQTTDYRPTAIKHHDTLMVSVSLSRQCLDIEPLLGIAEVAESLVTLLLNDQPNDDAFFPPGKSVGEIGDAWCIEVQSLGPIDFGQFQLIAEQLFAKVFRLTSIAELRERHLVQYVQTQLPFGWFCRFALQRGNATIPEIAPFYLLLSNATENDESLAASLFGEVFLNQLVLPDLKSISMAEEHPGLRSHLINLSEEIEEVAFRGANAPTKDRSTGDAVSPSEISSLLLRWGTVATKFLRNATTIQQNAINSTRTSDRVIHEFGIPDVAAKEFSNCVTHDVDAIRDQYLADKEWIEVEQQNTVQLAELARALTLEASESQLRRQSNVASLWFGMIGIILAAFGLPDWFSNNDEWQSVSLNARTTAVIVVFVVSGYLFWKGRQILLRS